MSDIEFTLSVNGTQFTVEMKKAGDVLRQLGFTSEKSSKSVSKIEETVSAVVQRLSSLRVATAGAAKNLNRVDTASVAIANRLRDAASAVLSADKSFTKIAAGAVIAADRLQDVRISGEAASKMLFRVEGAAGKTAVELRNVRAASADAASSVLRLDGASKSAADELAIVQRQAHNAATSIGRLNALSAGAAKQLADLYQAVNDVTAAFKNVGVAVNGANQRLNATPRVARASASALERVTAAVSGGLAKLRDYTLIISNVRGAIETLKATFVTWQAPIIEANAEMQRLKVLMTGLSSASTVEEAMRDGAEGTKWLIDMAQRVPFPLKEIGDAAAKLKSGGIDPMKGGLDALANAVAKFGGDTQLFHRAAIAIQQMAGKGVISMEEMRQQLGEAVPMAMQKLVLVTGMSMNELVKQISLGRLASAGTLDKMLDEFGRSFAGGAEAMMGTWNGMLSQMKTKIMLFFKDIGQAGYMDALTEAMGKVNDWLSSPAAKTSAIEIGKALATIIKASADLADFVVRNIDQIKVAIEILATVYLAGKMAAGLAVAQKAWLKFFSLGQASMLSNIITMFARMTTALSAGTGVFAAVRVAAAGMWGSVLLPATALVGSIVAVQLFMNWLGKMGNSAEETRKKVDSLTAANRSLQDSLRENPSLAYDESYMKGLNDQSKRLIEDQKQFRAEIEKNNAEIERLKELQKFSPDELPKVGGRVLGTKARGKSKADFQAEIDAVYAANARLEKAMVDSAKILENTQADLDAARVIKIEDGAASIAAAQKRVIAKNSRGIEMSYQAEVGRLTQAFNDLDKITSKGDRAAEQKRLVDERNAITKKFLDDQIAAMDRGIADLKARGDREVGDRAKFNAAVEILQKEKLEMIANANRQMETLANPVNLITNSDKEEKSLTAKAKKIQSFVDTIEEQYARLKADTNTPGEGGWAASMIEKLRDLRRATDMTSAKFAEIKAAIISTDIAAYTKRVSDATDEMQKRLSAQSAEMSGTNAAYGKYALQVGLYEEALVSLRKQIDGGTAGEGLKKEYEALQQMVSEYKGLLPKVLQQDEQYDKYRANLSALNSMASAFLTDARNIEDELATIGMDETDRMLRSLEIRKAEYLNYLNDLNLSDEDSARKRAALWRWEQAEHARINQAKKLEVIKLAENQESLARQVDIASTSWVEGFADSLTSLATSGKASFQELADSIIKDLIRIQIRTLILKAIQATMSMFSTSAAGAGGADMLSAPKLDYGFSDFRLSDTSAFAKGGIMTASGPLPLQMYASGGIATSPQVAIFGEGSMAEAFVPLPDGRSIPVTMTAPKGAGMSAAPTVVNIEVVNNTGQESRTEETTGPDGQIMRRIIIGEVARDIAENGAVFKSISSTFGMQRRPGTSSR